MSQIFHGFHGFLAVDEATEWTPEIVEYRLIECFEVIESLPGDGGGAGFWSRSVHDDEDMAGWDTKEPVRYKARASAEAIARAEESLSWAMTYLKGNSKISRDWSRALVAWAFHKAKHKSFSKYMDERGWKETSVTRFRKAGADLISRGLTRDKVRVREAYTGGRDMGAGGRAILR